MVNRTRKNIRIVFSPPADFVLTERRRAVSEFADDYTQLDRVSHLVSDEMMAADRAEREAAFKVLL